MKKMKLITLFLLFACLGMGCKKEVATLVESDVQVNTILVREDKSIQSAVVEEFDKDYYSQSELTTFVDEHIKKYNRTAGEGALTLDSLEVKDGNASVIFTFADINKYSEFNEVEAYYLTTAEAANNKILPDTFIDVSDGTSIPKEEAIADEKFKVFIVSEPLDVKVDGRIKYYSNAIVLNNTTVQSAEDGYTIVIFKP